MLGSSARESQRQQRKEDAGRSCHGRVAKRNQESTALEPKGTGGPKAQHCRKDAKTTNKQKDSENFGLTMSV